MITLEKWITFIKAHERLIVIGIIAFILFRAGQGIENMFVRYDDHKAQQAATQVVTDTNSNKTLADQIAQLKADSEQHNLVIDQEIKTAISGLAKQQQIDSQATQQQILDRWKLLLPLKPGAVQSKSGLLSAFV